MNISFCINLSLIKPRKSKDIDIQSSAPPEHSKF